MSWNQGNLLAKIKEVCSDEGNFTLVLSADNSFEQQQIIKSARWLQSEMFINLNTCEVQKIMKTEGVALSGSLQE